MYTGRDKLRAIKNAIPVLLAAALVLAWWGCTSLSCEKLKPLQEPFIAAKPWPDADRLFRSDLYWLGGDGAYSVDLGKKRVLWLFGDSLIDPAGSGDRKNAVVVRNSIAIQQGYDPTTSRITFYWGSTKKRADAYFSGDKGSWFWPGSGVRIEDVLMVFLIRIYPASNELGFEPAGTAGISVKNPDSTPEKWEIATLRIPKNNFGIIIGSAALCMDEYLYAFGTDATSGEAYLVRWSVSDAKGGDLSEMFWWSGHFWCRHDSMDGRPGVLFPGAQMEYTVHYESSWSLFVQVQTGSFTDRRLTFRTASEITGPWSGQKPFYAPSEDTDKDLLVYAGKAHHVLEGSEMIFTYAVNSLDMDRLVSDKALYYPVFVRGALLWRQ